MTNFFKTALSAVVCAVAFGANAEAQLNFSTPGYGYVIIDSSGSVSPDNGAPAQSSPMSFDALTGTLTINGTDANDICRVDMPVGYSTFSIIHESPSKKTQEYFYYYELKTIVFEGRGGDDIFEFTEEAIAKMEAYPSFYDLACDLRGGPGLDMLTGGIGSDILDGGDDNQEDILVGGAGADLFINHADVQYVPYYSWSTQKWSYFEMYENQEYELVLDYSPKYEGDRRLFKDQLEEFLNPTSNDVELMESTPESEEESNTPESYSSSSKTFFEEEESNLLIKK